MKCLIDPGPIGLVVTGICHIHHLGRIFHSWYFLVNKGILPLKSDEGYGGYVYSQNFFQSSAHGQEGIHWIYEGGIAC